MNSSRAAHGAVEHIKFGVEAGTMLMGTQLVGAVLDAGRQRNAMQDAYAQGRNDAVAEANREIGKANRTIRQLAAANAKLRKSVSDLVPEIEDRDALIRTLRSDCNDLLALRDRLSAEIETMKAPPSPARSGTSSRSRLRGDTAAYSAPRY